MTTVDEEEEVLVESATRGQVKKITTRKEVDDWECRDTLEQCLEDASAFKKDIVKILKNRANKCIQPCLKTLASCVDMHAILVRCVGETDPDAATPDNAVSLAEYGRVP